jgi:nitrile hydratase accessory protein
LTLPEAPFDEPWQAQAFALAVELHRQGAFTWTEWADALAGQIAARGDNPYYENWLAALEALATGKGLAAKVELADRKAAWERAFLTTPHGKPVELDARRPGG